MAKNYRLSARLSWWLPFAAVVPMPQWPRRVLMRAGIRVEVQEIK